MRLPRRRSYKLRQQIIDLLLAPAHHAVLL